MTSTRRPPFPEVEALRRLLREPAYRGGYLGLALVVAMAYAFLLPGLLLGTLSLGVLRFLTPLETTVAVGFGLLLPLVLLLNLYLWKHLSCVVAPGRPFRGPVTALVLSLVPNALCCTPLVPFVLALVLSGASLALVSPALQAFFGAYAPLFYALSLLALWLSLRLASRRVTSVPPATTHEADVAPARGPPAPTDLGEAEV